MNPQKTGIDWLTFRTQSAPQEALEALRPSFGTLGECLELKSRDRGRYGYKYGSQIVVEDMVLANLDYGGESQRGWCRVDLPGSACQWVEKWSLDQLCDLERPEPTRVDVALTTWRGEVTHDMVIKAHELGRFTLRRPPAMQMILNTDHNVGRTCNIGSRKSDKFMRCYEKGWEMLSALPSSVDRSSITSVEGFPPADIYRCEVEFKNVTTSIPWDVIERRDEYFAGAYPFCADILPCADTDAMLRRPERLPQRTLEHALENVRVQYGPTLFTALTAYGGDIMAVWERVIGRTHSQSLLEAGVLLVDHDA